MRFVEKTAPYPKAGKEHGNGSLINQVSLPELLDHLDLFAPCQAVIGPDDRREQDHGWDGRPVDELAENGQEDSCVLRMPGRAVKAASGQTPLATGSVHLSPSFNQKGNPEKDESVP